MADLASFPHQLVAGEQELQRYHIAQVVEKPGIFKALINKLRRKKNAVLGDLFLLLTDHRLIFIHKIYPKIEKGKKPGLIKRVIHKIFPPTSIQNLIEYNMRDIHLADISKVSAGFEKRFGNQSFYFTAETLGEETIQISPVYGKSSGKTLFSKYIIPLFGLFSHIFFGDHFFNTTPESEKFCDEIGTQIVTHQT